MSLSKQLAVLSLSAAALGLALTPIVSAAALSITPPAKSDNLTVLAASKSKAKKAKAGSCGTNMYWSSKSRKCMDARDKKAS